MEPVILFGQPPFSVRRRQPLWNLRSPAEEDRLRSPFRLEFARTTIEPAIPNESTGSITWKKIVKKIGDRGADHAALDWPTRVKIIRGIARGMAYLHAELTSHDVPHGNLKTANVLLAANFQPLLADYGLLSLVSPSVAPNVLFAFKSPESPHVSPKSDVYCFGIVLIEILTGRFPSQYLDDDDKGGIDVVSWAAAAVSEGREADLVDPQIVGRAGVELEMVQMLRVGAACTRVRPERRPEMVEAAVMVEDIADDGEVEYVDLAGTSQTRRDGSLPGPRESRRPERSVQEQWSADLIGFD